MFQETTYTNALGADVHGVEFTVQQMLGWGFGLEVNGTYVATNKNFQSSSLTSNQFALPGVGNSANFIGFYDAHGLQARLTVQWQDSQLASLGQEQSGRCLRRRTGVPGSLDGSGLQHSVSVHEHLSAYFEALNLTDDVYHTYGRFTNQTLNLVELWTVVHDGRAREILSDT